MDAAGLFRAPAALTVVFLVALTALVVKHATHRRHIEASLKAIGVTEQVENPRFEPSVEEQRRTGAGRQVSDEQYRKALHDPLSRAGHETPSRPLSVVTHRPKLTRQEFYRIARTSLEQPKYPYLAAKAPPKLPEYFKYMERELLPSRDQGQCGSCWAFAVAAMLADRASLMTGGKVRNQLSVQEMLACDNVQGGCAGGAPETALEYALNPGILPEQDYPYEQVKSDYIAPCIEKPGKRLKILPGSIRSLCEQLDDEEIGSEKHRRNILNMKREIYDSGPIIGTIMVYSDLYEYDAQGVYSVSPGAEFIGGHAIEIFGWSDENANTGEPNFRDAYWVCRNSWGYDWPSSDPDNYGWFWVRMGENTAGIESRAVRAVPEVPKKDLDPRGVKNRYDSFEEYISDAERAHFTGDPDDFGVTGKVHYISHIGVAGAESEEDYQSSFWRRLLTLLALYLLLMFLWRMYSRRQK